MHICFLCNEYPPAPHGGVGSLTQTLARALVRHGHRSTVLGCYPGSEDRLETDCGVHVVRLAHAPVRGTGFVVNGHRLRTKLLAIHAESPIDVIEGPENSLANAPARISARRVIRMNGGHHFFAVTLGRKPRAWRSWLERRSFARATDLCAVSHYVAETTRRLLKLPAQRIEVLPNPVDTALFQPMSEPSEQDGLILFAGTVCEKKGVRQLVLALPTIVAAVPHARLAIAGRDSHDSRVGGSFIEYLRGLIPDRLRDHVEFHGALDHATLPRVIAKASVCVYPSHMEALPLAWLEGMAMGKAVVGSETGPGPEVIEDGVSGLLCNPHDPNSIAWAVVRLLRDPHLRRRFGAEARRRALREFSDDTLIQRNLAFYRRCLEPAHV